ncbi:hypothetical protein EST38_g9167 [Candolleomyces aberdarensis]|uniref:Uncharacterized protein n=1 Tax=Candolleomyces aberdarensis TaxID=2316362 RepID=A0A4Q2DAN4_9AGAR|nr:hypothetical protein EST38_g9167 [Candolleomyces aberdarensis]
MPPRGASTSSTRIARLEAKLDRERDGFNLRESTLTEQLKELSSEKDELTQDVRQKQVELDWERAMSEEMVKKLEGIGQENASLWVRVSDLESTVARKQEIQETLEKVILALEAEKEEHVRIMSSVKQDLSHARQEAQSSQEQYTKELKATTAENRLFLQRLKDERAARKAERAQSSKERSDQQHQFEGVRRELTDRIAALVQAVQTKEQDRIELDKYLATVKREKEEVVASLAREVEEAEAKAKKQINGLQETLDNIKSTSGADKKEHVRTISALEQNLSYARQEMQNSQAQYTKELKATTAENRLLLQQLKDERAARRAERAQSLKERSDQQREFEGARMMLDDRVAALAQNVQAKEQDCVGLQEDLATVRREKGEAMACLKREMEEAGAEAKKQINGFHEAVDHVKSVSEADKKEYVRNISSLEQELSHARQEMRNSQARCTRELEAATAENRLLSQQLEDEKAGRDAERAQSLKERSEQQQQFEGARRVLGEQVAALVQDLQTKEQDCVKLEQDLATVRRDKEKAVASLEREKEEAEEEAKKQIDSLQETMESVIYALEADKEALAQTISSLEQDLSHAREEMQNAQARYTKELKAATAENRLLSLRLEDEEAERKAEHAQSLKERSDQQRQFEGARRMLDDKVVALMAKEQDSVRLEEYLATVGKEKEEAVASLEREMEEVKAAKKQIDSLHKTLENVKSALEAERGERARTISSLEQDLSDARQEVQNSQTRYMKELNAATAENRLLSLQLEDEKAARKAEQEQSLKERSDQQQFEGARRMLDDRVAALVAKELDSVKLGDNLATVRKEKEEAVASLEREMEEAKEEAKKQIDSLQEMLENVKSALEAEKEKHIRTLSSLEQDLLHTKEGMQNAQVQCTKELEAAIIENRLLSQRLEDERVARGAERAQLVKEKSDQEQQIDGAGRVLGEQVAALGQDLQAKLQQEMDSAKGETKKQIDDLNDKLDQLKKARRAEKCTIM